MAWRTSKRSTKLAGNKKIQRIKKVKIRWGVLGLNAPGEETPSMSIEEVRRQVTMLASRGIGTGARSRGSVDSVQINGGDSRSGNARRGRRGSSE